MIEARPTLGVLAVALRDGEVCLVKRKNPPDQGLWGFPGGKVDAGETVAAAAIRELAEETGLGARPGPELGWKEIIHRDAAGQLLFHYYLVAIRCDGAAGEPVAADDAAAAAWVADTSVLAGDLPLSDGVAALLSRARASDP